MDFNPINSSTTTAATATTAPKSNTAAEKAAEKKPADTTAEKPGVVYEKGDTTASETVSKPNAKKPNTALIAQMKKDAEERTAQLRSIVEKMMSQQGTALGKADSMWSFLAKGNYTVDAATKAQAQKDIADDGYWGVEQTSDRIIDFAKALSGDDPEKADEMIAAFQKGFKQATKAWGDKLPDISQRTYDAVMEKFDAWKNGTKPVTGTETEA